MAKAKIQPEELGAALTEILEDYTEDLTVRCNKASETTARAGAEDLKSKAQSSGIGGRKYNRSFASKLLNESPLGNTYVIYSRQYRIAHLLEHGHLIVAHGKYTGKRTRAFHHWSKVEADVSTKLEDSVKRAVQELNRG